MAVSVTLTDDIDLSRGDMIARLGNRPTLTQDLDATVCWMADEQSLKVGSEYLVKHTTRTTKARVVAVEYRLDVNTLHRDSTASSLALNEIGRVRLRTQTPLLVDDFRRNTATGSFILIDPVANTTVAAGMVLPQTTDTGDVAASSNTVRHASLISAKDRLTRGGTIWFTGLSGSGKSSVAVEVERALIASGRPAFVLDGDNLRHGLNADLGFGLEDRRENLRRLAHVAALLAGAGLLVLVPAISPLREHRDFARRVHIEAGLDFREVFMDVPIAVCEARDPKGLYARARGGEISDFTGIDSPYEPPEHPDLALTPDQDVATMTQRVKALLP